LKPIRKRKDLVDVKALPCKLLGFEGTLIYCLLTPDGRIILSSNVIFQEKRPHIAEALKRHHEDKDSQTEGEKEPPAKRQSHHRTPLETDLIPLGGGGNDELPPWPMDPKSLSLQKDSQPPEGNSTERDSPPTLSDSLRDSSRSTLDNAEHIDQHPRSNKGHYSESNPQSYGRYMIL